MDIDNGAGYTDRGLGMRNLAKRSRDQEKYKGGKAFHGDEVLLSEATKIN
ncbi:hypothetical protein GCM10028827_08440 [Mucilaginibacter myungsuensis]